MSTVQIVIHGTWILICSICVLEFFLLLPLSKLLSALLYATAHTLKTIASQQLSDEEKATEVPKAAFRMFGSSSLLLCAILSILTLYAGLSYLGESSLTDWLQTHQYINYPLEGLFTLSSILIMLLTMFIYFIVRQRLISLFLSQAKQPDEISLLNASEQDYSLVAQGIHAVALDNPVVPKTLHRLDLWMNRSTRLAWDQHQSPSILWISGLARAGTSILTDLLYQTHHFRSLTYRDMPFPMSPHLWNRLQFFGQKKAVEKERAHGDGLMVSVDSPEALEEIFWRIWDGDQYINDQHVSLHTISDPLAKQFTDYIAHILCRQTSENDRYLAKNNNHLIRIPSLLKHYPHAQIIVPFRDPLQHAESLRRQHVKWCERHQQDPFSQSYMSWLAHHEFGLDHKAFEFEKSINQLLENEFPHLELTEEVSTLINDPMQLPYWLTRWIEAYAFVLQTNIIQSSQVILICYEDLTEYTSETLDALYTKITLSLSDQSKKQLASRIKAAPQRENLWPYQSNKVMGFEELQSLYTLSYNLYEKLRSYS